MVQITTRYLAWRKCPRFNPWRYVKVRQASIGIIVPRVVLNFWKVTSLVCIIIYQKENGLFVHVQPSCCRQCVNYLYRGGGRGYWWLSSKIVWYSHRMKTAWTKKVNSRYQIVYMSNSSTSILYSLLGWLMVPGRKLVIRKIYSQHQHNFLYCFEMFTQFPSQKKSVWFRPQNCIRRTHYDRVVYHDSANREVIKSQYKKIKSLNSFALSNLQSSKFVM